MKELMISPDPIFRDLLFLGDGDGDEDEDEDGDEDVGVLSPS